MIILFTLTIITNITIIIINKILNPFLLMTHELDIIY
jgi:hypothetical protein